MVEFGITLAPPSEPMQDRHAWYAALLRQGEGVFTSAWVADHLMKDDQPMVEAWTTIDREEASSPAALTGRAGSR